MQIGEIRRKKWKNSENKFKVGELKYDNSKVDSDCILLIGER